MRDGEYRITAGLSRADDDDEAELCVPLPL